LVCFKKEIKEEELSIV